MQNPLSGTTPSYTEILQQFTGHVTKRWAKSSANALPKALAYTERNNGRWRPSCEEETDDNKGYYCLRTGLTLSEDAVHL